MSEENQRLTVAESIISDGVPKDKQNLVSMIQFLFGFGILLPFNVALACMDFYKEKVSINRYSDSN